MKESESISMARAWTHAEWGGSGLCENALYNSSQELRAGVRDVLCGNVFDRCLSDGRLIEIRIAREDYL